MKILFVFWLLSPATKGASILYRKFLHPQLSKREKVRSFPLSHVLDNVCASFRTTVVFSTSCSRLWIIKYKCEDLSLFLYSENASFFVSFNFARQSTLYHIIMLLKNMIFFAAAYFMDLRSLTVSYWDAIVILTIYASWLDS